jgi:TRAP-type C4-dicarboxylate transport system substrate-binding protein
MRLRACVDGTFLTPAGLSLIVKELAVLSAPGAIESYGQLERVLARFNAEWSAKLAEKGFVLAGWGEAGMVRYFSRIPITGPSDLKKVRPWVWPASRTMTALWKVLGAKGQPLSAPEVHGGILTGMIDAVMATAIGASSMQWFPKPVHITKRTLGPLPVAMVISKEWWDSLDSGNRELLEELIAKHHVGDAQNMRKDDERAYAALTQRGYVTTSFTPEGEQAYQAAEKRARERLVGGVYSRALLDEVMAVARAGTPAQTEEGK